MRFELKHLYAGTLVALAIAGCSAPPATRSSSVATTAVAPTKPIANPVGFDEAMRFLRSWGAGEIIQASMQKTMDQTRIDQPGMAELMRRVLADIRVEDLETLAARVYARHLSKEHLEALAQFSETAAGKRFFKEASASTLSGKQVNPQEIMRTFNADELTEVLKFGLSDSFRAMQAELPSINNDLKEEGRKLGESKVREYVRRK